MKLTYIGTEERVFPSLGATVKPGDVIDAPEDFSHPDFSASGAVKKTSETPNKSAASDAKVGE